MIRRLWYKLRLWDLGCCTKHAIRKTFDGYKDWTCTLCDLEATQRAQQRRERDDAYIKKIAVSILRSRR